MSIGFVLISFLAGILTVLAPCILPLLPVIVGGSIGEKTSVRKVATIVMALGASVIIFTLILKVSTAFITIPQLIWQIVSGGLLILFGVISLVPTRWDRLPGVSKLYISSNKILGSGYQKHSLGGDIIIGAALGPVFSSCSPTYFVILAAVLPAHFLSGLIYLIVYTLGLCLFLFVIAFLGQKAATKLGIVADPHGRFKKIIGVIFILVGIAILFGIDKRVEASLPSGAFGEIGLEQQLLAGKTLKYQKAPELVSPDGYVNTGGQPITIGQFKGKNVVLIDFWDYSCINCQRTIPYLNAWYKKYKDQGLVIIGVHTPEFAFEQVQSNVENATKRFGMTYPVVLDNKYQTWNAFQNQYWPREYVVDIDGFIVHDHAGEGEYDQTEKAIQAALAERASRLGTTTIGLNSTVAMPAPDLSGINSPETYFGSNRNEYLGNGRPGQSGSQEFTIPAVIETNTLYLGGTWNIKPEYAEASAGASVEFQYNSRDVYIVATNPGAATTIKVFRDGTAVGTFGGTDVNQATSEVTVNGDRLYKLIHDPVPGVHTIKIEVEKGTLDAYTFTFG